MKAAHVDPLLMTEAISSPTLENECGPGRCALFSYRSPAKESENEDGLLVWHSGHQAVLAVADGVGGSRSGAVASQLALSALQDELQQESETPIRARVIDAFERANRTVLQHGTGAATTLAVVTIEDNRVRTFHVGDSAVLICGQRSRLRWLTVAHSPVGFAVEAGVLDEKDALFHEERHIVSNVVGSPAMRIEIGPRLTLNPRDTVLLASDGVFDNFHLPEIVDIVRAGSMHKQLEVLRTQVLQRMTTPEHDVPSKPDDCTAIMFRLQTKTTGARQKPVNAKAVGT